MDKRKFLGPQSVFPATVIKRKIRGPSADPCCGFDSTSGSNLRPNTRDGRIAIAVSNYHNVYCTQLPRTQPWNGP